MSESTLITSQDPKGLQIASLFEATLNKAKLDPDRARRLIENGGKFQDDLAQIIERLSTTGHYDDEEGKSSYGYFSGYKPKGITEQVNGLHRLFPGIGFANERLAEQSVPPGAEGWFAIPRWEKVAKTYSDALLKVLDAIGKTHHGQFCNWRNGNMHEKHIRQLARTAKLLKRLGEEQEGYDILVVPCQFGLRHRGRSVRRTREVMLSNEFGLGAFAVGMMLLTHPERLQHCDDLWIDCAGDEFSNEGNEVFDSAQFFYFGADRVCFDTYWFDGANDHFGSASALLSQ